MAKTKNTDIAKAIHLATVGKTGADLSSALKSVVRFLARNRLLSQSPKILGELAKISNKENGIVEANTWSVLKLDEKMKVTLGQVLKKKYSAKGVVFNEKLDARVLGGVKVEVGDEVIDLTIKNKINKLQEHLVAKI